MTSRERLLRCIKRKPIDRVPISVYELCGFDSDSWAYQEPSYARIMEFIREKTDCILMVDPVLNDSQTEYITQSHREGKTVFGDTVWHTPAGDFFQKSRVDDVIKTTWTLEHFVKSTDDVERLLSFDWQPLSVDMTSFYVKQRQLGENGIMMMTLTDPVCEAASLMGMEDFLITALTEQDLMTRFLDMLFERQLHTLRQIVKHDVTDVMFRICGPEYCTPPYMPPELFTKYVTGYVKVYCELINQAGGISRVHSHGKVKQVLDDIVETGAMCVDPLEAPPDGDITLAEVKKQYGDKLILFGNMQLKDLEVKTADQIRQLTREVLDSAAGGGGFVLLPTATPINIPLSRLTENNIITMVETALEYGQY